MKTLTQEQIIEMPLDEYIFWLNSMTTPELHEQFPGEFHVLKASDNQNESVTNLLANDAILWKFVKTHAQKLASELTKKEVKTEDEILKASKILRMCLKRSGIRVGNETFQDIVYAMQEFAKWALSLKAQQPSDEDIEEYFLIEEPRGYGCSYYSGLVQGAIAMREDKIPSKK